MQRLHHKKYRDTLEKLHQAWERYEEDEITTNQLLRTASHITGLGPLERPGDDYTEDDIWVTYYYCDECEVCEQYVFI